MKKQLILLPFVFLFLTMACKKETIEVNDVIVNADGEIQIPLVYGNIAFDELLKDLSNNDTSIVGKYDKTIDDSVITFIYRKDELLTPIKYNDFAEVKVDTTKTDTLISNENSGKLIHSNTRQRVYNDTIQYVLPSRNGILIDRMEPSNGTIEVSGTMATSGMKPSENDSVIIYITSTDLYQLNGADTLFYSRTILRQSDTVHEIEPTEILLKDYIVDPLVKDEKSTLRFFVTADAINHDPDSTNHDTADYRVQQTILNISTNDVGEYKIIYCYFRQQEFDTLVSADIDLPKFDNVTGTFGVDPIININYNNSIGMPVTVSILLKSYLDGREYLYQFETFVMNGLESIEQEEKLYTQSFMNPQSVRFDNKIYDSITNIDQLVRFPPSDSFAVGILAITNANFKDSLNFVKDASELSIGMDIEIPMLITSNLRYEKEYVKPNELNNFETFDYFYIVYDFENQLPIGFDGYIVLLDSNDVDSIGVINLKNSEGKLIPASKVDSRGLLIDPDGAGAAKGSVGVDGKTALLLASDRVKKLKVVLYVKSSTLDKQVYILEDYKLNMSLGLKVKGSYKQVLLEKEEN
ncbi:hypothetical protein OAO55_03080 [Bacteroidales bacterium]|nr:hypothetical protein [Bacteroidales bacterium]